MSRCGARRPGDNAEHFRSIDDAGLAELRQRALRWAIDNGEKLDGAEPDMPPGFDNRLGDNWYLLLAIADFAGGDWPDKARKAAVKLSKVADATSTGVQVLAAIKAVFDGEEGNTPPDDRITSADLAATLGADTTSPWAEWKNSKPITQAQLARVLKPFGIAPAKIRLSSGGTLQGYVRSQFEDAWDRYLSPGIGTFKVEQWNAMDKGQVAGFQSGTEGSCSTLEKCQKHNNHRICSGVPL